MKILNINEKFTADDLLIWCILGIMILHIDKKCQSYGLSRDR